MKKKPRSRTACLAYERRRAQEIRARKAKERKIKRNEALLAGPQKDALSLVDLRRLNDALSRCGIDAGVYTAVMHPDQFQTLKDIL